MSGARVRHCGACPALLEVYLCQDEFLRVVWEVLGRDDDIMLCDEHCVHRALAVARVLASMTRCTVDYSAVGLHPCITEVWPDDVRQITFVCKDGSPDGWSVHGHFERCLFSRSRVVIPGAGVHVCPTLDPARVWVPVQSQAGSGAERAAGYAPPTT